MKRGVKMKTQITFNIYKEQIETFTQIVPHTLRARTICKFLKNEYLPPKVFNTRVEFEAEVYPIRMDQDSILKLDTIMIEDSKRGTGSQKDISRSVIMRDVFNQFIMEYKSKPIPKPERKRTLLHVAEGTIDTLAQYIGKYERNRTIEEFILEEYNGPKASTEELKQKLGNEPELMPITLDEGIFETLQEIADEYGYGVKRSHILRDVINQLSEKLKVENHNK